MIRSPPQRGEDHDQECQTEHPHHGPLLPGHRYWVRFILNKLVVGGLMHARPKFFAKVMGELLFWVGEDKMTFGSDYNIWTPKWQVEGLVDWQMPDDDQFADYPRLTTASKKKILGLNAAKLYDHPLPEVCLP